MKGIESLGISQTGAGHPAGFALPLTDRLTQVEPLPAFTRAKSLSGVRSKAEMGLTCPQINLSKECRQVALSGLWSGKCRIPKTADTTAYDLDIVDVSHVVKYDVPRLSAQTSTASTEKIAPDQAPCRTLKQAPRSILMLKEKLASQGPGNHAENRPAIYGVRIYAMC